MPDRSWRYPIFLLLILGFGLEFLFGWHTWWREGEATPLWLICALGGALGTASGLSLLTRGSSWLLFWLFLGLALFIPLYGAIGSLLIALYLRRDTGGALMQQYAEQAESEEGRTDEEGEYRVRGSVDQMIRHELNVQSYMDIMRGPDRVLKKALIGKILSEWTPNAVALLKQGLKDPEYEIRSYASTALTTIENRMNERILQFRESLEETPGETSLRIKLSRSYLDYAGSGLLDAGSVLHYVHMAGDILEEVPDPPEQERDLWLQLLSLRAQAARLAGDREMEESLYDRILERHPAHQETLSHRCALLFEQRRFSELRSTCDRFLSHTAGDHPALEAARLWSSASQPVEGVQA